MVYILFGCLSSWYLTGLSWTIGVVTYPGFSLIGTSEWHRFHEFHSRRIALAVGPMWAVEMLASALWVLRAPQGTQALSIVAGVAALSTVALTVFWAVPAHNRLSQAFSPKLSRRLGRAHSARTAAWTIAATCATIALSQHLS